MADTAKPEGGTYTDQNATNNAAAMAAASGANQFGQAGLGQAYYDVSNFNMPQMTSRDATAAMLSRGSIRDVGADTRGAEQRLNAVMGQAYGAGQYRPGAGMNDFFGYAGPMMQLAQGNYSPLTQGMNRTAGDQARLGINNAASQFSGRGALHSGAAMGAMGEAAARPFAEVANTLGMQRANLSGQLLNTAMPLGIQDQQFRTSAGLQAAGFGMQGAGMGYRGAELGLQGQMANQGMDWNAAQSNQSWQNQIAQGNQNAFMMAQQGNQNAGITRMQGLAGLGSSYGSYGAAGMGAMGSLGQSAYTYNPSAWDYAMQGIGALGSLAGGAEALGWSPLG